MRLWALRLCAILIALRALTDVFKPLGAGSGLVVGGVFLHGAAVTLLAPLVGAYMLVYACGLWQGRRFALAMGIAYALYASINVALFPVFQGLPGGFNVPAYVGFAVVGMAVPWAAVWLLAVQRAAS